MRTNTSITAKMLSMFMVLAFNAPFPVQANDKLKALSIQIPNKVGSLIVGKSNYTDVVSLLGKPELIENEKIESTKQKILDLKYPRKGIEFTIDKNKQMRVVRIEVYKPFTGSSAEGLRLGMDFKMAKKIIESRYGKPSIEFEGYIDWEIPNTFAIKYEDGLVIAIKMLGP